MTLVDTNILLDFISRDRIWLQPSLSAFSLRSAFGPMRIVDAIFAECSVSFPNSEACAAFLNGLDVSRSPMSEEALFQAGQAFRRYRARGGVKSNVLPDFFIGAQAQVEGWTILTRDALRYRTYFPGVEVVEP